MTSASGPVPALATGPIGPSGGLSPAAGSVPPPPADRIRHLINPPERGVNLFAWLMLGVCLLAGLPAMLIEFQHPDVTNRDEARALATTLETYNHPRAPVAPGTSFVERWAPYYAGQPDYLTPPWTTWVQSIALADTPHGSATAATLIVRARLLSIIAALAAIACAYWAGRSLGGDYTGLFAGLLLAAHPAFILHARLASPAMPMTALSLLSVAAALWAIRPLKSAPSVWRQAIGWGLSGIAMGGAILAGGLVGLLVTALPVLLLTVICPGRLSHTMGWLASLLLGLLLAAPWYLYAGEHDTAAWATWVHQVLPESHPGGAADAGRQIATRALFILIAGLPWTLWLVGAVVQPFSTSSAGSRTRLFLGWSWFIGVGFALLIIPAGGRIGDMLPVVPAMALLVAQLFSQYTDLAGEGRYARFWRGLRWPYLALMVIVSATTPLLLSGSRFVGDVGSITHGLAAGLPLLAAVGLVAVLLIVTALAGRAMLRHYPGRALVLACAWCLVGMAVLAIPIAHGARFRSDIAPDARAVGSITAGAPVYYLRDTADSTLEPAMLLYSGAPIGAIQPALVAEARDRLDRFFVLAAPGAAASLPESRTIRRLDSLHLDLIEVTGHPQPATRAAPAAASPTTQPTP